MKKIMVYSSQPYRLHKENKLIENIKLTIQVITGLAFFYIIYGAMYVLLG